MHWPFCESQHFTLRSGCNVEINWRGQNRTSSKRFTQTLNFEYKCACMDSFGHYTHATMKGVIKYVEKQRLFFLHGNKSKANKTGQMRWGRSCQLLLNSCDSIKSFFRSANDKLHQWWREWLKDREEAAESLIAFGMRGAIRASSGRWLPLHPCDRHCKSMHIFAVFG